jgi:hypothetical protein
LLTQGNRQAVSEEGHEEMRFNPLRFLMIYGADRQVAFEGAERLLDEHQLHVISPQFVRIIVDNGLPDAARSVTCREEVDT